MNILPISLLIPTMNRPETLERTLKSYVSGDYQPSQIVVVDQSEREVAATEIQNILSKLPTEIQTEYVYQEIPSLTKARNAAKARAKEEILVYSDDDIEVYADTLKNVFDLLSNENISMIGAIDDLGKKSSTKAGYFLGTRSFKNRRIGCVTASVLGRYPDEIKGEIETQWAMGYFFAVKKSLTEKWGISWDENLTGYAYAEDLDFSYAYYKRSKLEGLKCILSDKVRVKHLVSQEYRIPSKKSTYMYVLHRAYLCHKHKMGFKSRLAIKWCDFWQWVERVVKKANSKDMRAAKKYLKKHKKEVYNGIFRYEG